MPGLAAKPILDLLLSVAAIELRARYVQPLERLGYLFSPAPESSDFHFFDRPPERPRTYHLHVCEAGSEHEFRHVAVRDFPPLLSSRRQAYSHVMAEERKPKAGWLERRRDAKRAKREKRAKRIAEQRQHEGAGAEHATRGWQSSSGPGPG